MDGRKGRFHVLRATRVAGREAKGEGHEEIIANDQTPGMLADLCESLYMSLSPLKWRRKKTIADLNEALIGKIEGFGTDFDATTFA